MTRIKTWELLMQTKKMSLQNAKDNSVITKHIWKLHKRSELSNFILEIQNKLKNITNSHLYKGNCSKKECEFLLSKIYIYDIPHFYIIWKILKNPIVGRPIVARYNWILTPASIFVGHYLKEFYSKFDNILTDSLSLIKILEKTKFKKEIFYFHGGFQKSIQ